MADRNTTKPQQPQQPAELLRQLDAWLSNTGHGSSHPWRAAIGATLAAERTAADRPAPDFEPFAWHTKAAELRPMEGRRAMQFAGLARDMAAGTATVLGMLERQGMEADFLDTGRPLMSDHDAANLMRLAVSALKQLALAADDLIDTHEPRNPGGADHA
jgi:hypothetical protein